MNNKMKKVNVEIEMPVDVEVSLVRKYDGSPNEKFWFVVETQSRKPKKLIFEEIIGRDYVEKGEYWIAGPGIVKASGRYLLEEDEAAYKLVEEC